jgi:hypothetical protein
MDGVEQVRDLGELSGGPVLLFGGAYSNLQALQSMLAVAQFELGIPPQRIIHTGDVVAYCAQPRETCELLQSSGIHCLMGNCEESIAQGNLDCGCGFPEDSACQEYSVNWYAHVMKEIKGYDALKEWMGQLPRHMYFSMCGRRFAVVHGSAAHISKFLWPSTPDEVLREDMALLPEAIDCVVCGHSGIPFARLVPPEDVRRNGAKERLWLNAGVIGMPANDGTPRSWFAVLTPQGDGIEVSIRALSFDADEAAAAIYRQPALNRGYADALTGGIWPSHDILPLEEQMATGVALSETSIVWKTRAKRFSALLQVHNAEVALVVVAACAGIAASAAWLARRRSVKV